jgi:hypothetical protein
VLGVRKIPGLVQGRVQRIAHLASEDQERETGNLAPIAAGGLQGGAGSSIGGSAPVRVHTKQVPQLVKPVRIGVGSASDRCTWGRGIFGGHVGQAIEPLPQYWKVGAEGTSGTERRDGVREGSFL